jgi:hypothetical protein
MRRFGFVAFLALACVVPARAQEPVAQKPAGASVPADDTAQLKALIYVLQSRLADVEKELGQEKARRAELEQAELVRARETLDPAVKMKLGLPVPNAPKATKIPVTPQTPPK